MKQMQRLIFSFCIVSGRLAQLVQSAALTRRRSLVRSQQRPPTSSNCVARTEVEGSPEGTPSEEPLSVHTDMSRLWPDSQFGGCSFCSQAQFGLSSVPIFSREALPLQSRGRRFCAKGASASGGNPSSVHQTFLEYSQHSSTHRSAAKPGALIFPSGHTCSL